MSDFSGYNIEEAARQALFDNFVINIHSLDNKTAASRLTCLVHGLTKQEQDTIIKSVAFFNSLIGHTTNADF